MIWRDEECVDFDDFRQSKLKGARLREEEFNNEEGYDNEGEEVEFNGPEDRGDLIDLDVAMNADKDIDLIDFDAIVSLKPATPTTDRPLHDEIIRGQNPDKTKILPPPLTPHRVTPAPQKTMYITYITKAHAPKKSLVPLIDFETSY